MALTERQRRRRLVLRTARQDARYQFGQPPSTTSKIPDGNACGANQMQMLDRCWHPTRRRTMDQVVTAARATGLLTRKGGLYFSEMFTAAVNLDLPYVQKRNLDAIEVVRMARDVAPVLFVGSYGAAPEWKGYVYYGTKADGKPNGYATPSGEAGKNQLSGFTGQHYYIVLTAEYKRNRWFIYVRDSNHDSIARPEKPPYHVMNFRQFERLYNAGGRATNDHKNWALVPTMTLKEGN